MVGVVTKNSTSKHSLKSAQTPQTRPCNFGCANSISVYTQPPFYAKLTS